MLARQVLWQCTEPLPDSLLVVSPYGGNPNLAPWVLALASGGGPGFFISCEVNLSICGRVRLVLEATAPDSTAPRDTQTHSPQ